ncbi:MAG: hypothetical protein P8123_08315 [bacterium]
MKKAESWWGYSAIVKEALVPRKESLRDRIDVPAWKKAVTTS